MIHGRRQRQTTSPVLLAVFIFVMSASAAAAQQDPAQAPGEAYWKHRYEYVYYPTSAIYYAPMRNRWFWRDGDSWRESSQLPVAFADQLGGAVRVNLDTPQPYQRHEVVRQQYPDP